MNHNKLKLDENNLNKLINHANNLVKLLYFLFIAGIILAGIIVIKELSIIHFVLGIISVLSPVIIGFIIAWLFNPLVVKLKSKGVKKPLAIFIIVTLIIFILFLFFKIFIPVLYKQVNDLIKVLPSIINSFSNILDKFSAKFLKEGIDISDFKNNLINGINDYSNSFSSKLPSYVINMTKSFFSILGIILMGFVVAIYLLIDYENIFDKCLKICHKDKSEETKNLFKNMSEEVRKTVNGTFLVALMVLVGDTIAFSIIGLPSPLLFGLLCGLTDLIPFIGPYIGGGAAVIVGFTKSTVVGVWVLIACIIVQSLENYILQPIVMSKATKLNPVVIIIVLLLFGHFLGILGMIIATPILALFKVIYEYLCNKKKTI